MYLFSDLIQIATFGPILEIQTNWKSVKTQLQDRLRSGIIIKQIPATQFPSCLHIYVKFCLWPNVTLTKSFPQKNGVRDPPP